VCGRLKSDINRRLTVDKFLLRANNMHGNNYDYSYMKYETTEIKIKIKCNTCNRIFNQRPINHMRGDGCPYCSYNISIPEIEFLNYCNIPNNKEHRQKYIKPYKPDGYDSSTNTICEFLGDYWHGNPDKFKSTYFNQRCKKTAGELYIETINKFDALKSLGYNIKYIWESDWKKFKCGNDKFPNIILY